jgi:HlyD family secretion protein
MVNRIAMAWRRGSRQPEKWEASPPGVRALKVGVRRKLPSVRTLVISALALASVVLIARRMRTGGVHVETARVDRETLRVTVSGTGKSRVHERHVISAPVSGRLQRIRFQPGDAVRLGQVLATIEPPDPTPLDARSRAEQQARLAAALAAEARAWAAAERARAAEAAAESDRERAQNLSSAGAISSKDLESAELAWRSRAAERAMAEASAEQARGDADAARAVLATPSASRSGGAPITSPLSGSVLRVRQESEGLVQAGAPLLEVADLKDLEIAVDLLTTDAVRVFPGAPVEIEHWGGVQALSGKVRRIDPSGFTKVSALGVEEQRVYVVVAPPSEGAWAGLSDNYNVEAQIVVAERSGVLSVPVASLIRRQDGWNAFVVEKGRSALRQLQIGEMASDMAEVKSGLAEGDTVILYPNDQIQRGTPVQAE